MGLEPVFPDNTTLVGVVVRAWGAFVARFTQQLPLLAVLNNIASVMVILESAHAQNDRVYGVLAGGISAAVKEVYASPAALRFTRRNAEPLGVLPVNLALEAYADAPQPTVFTSKLGFATKFVTAATPPTPCPAQPPVVGLVDSVIL